MSEKKESITKQTNQSAAASTSNIASYADPNIEVADDDEVLNVDDNILDTSVETLISQEQADVTDELFENFDRLENEFDIQFGEKLHEMFRAFFTEMPMFLWCGSRFFWTEEKCPATCPKYQPF